MLEAYTALGFLAAVTERVQLLAWVTAAVYREPGLLAKEVTTLDVLSKGRAMLGIGAAWNEEECRRARPALPVHRRALRAARGDPADLPPDVERQRRAVCRQALPARPHPQLAAVGAAARTRRSSSAAAARRRRCGSSRSTPRPATSSTAPTSRTSSTCCAGTATTLGRDYDEIEKTVMGPIDPGPNGENVDATLEHLRDLAGLGVTHVQTGIARRLAHRLCSSSSASGSSPRPPSSERPGELSRRPTTVGPRKRPFPRVVRGVSRLQADQWSSGGDEGVCRWLAEDVAAAEAAVGEHREGDRPDERPQRAVQHVG